MYIKIISLIKRSYKCSDKYLDYNPRSIKKFPDYPFQVATSRFTSSHYYIVFHTYSVVICIGITP